MRKKIDLGEIIQEIDILNWIYNTLGCSAMDYLSLTFEYLFKYDIIWIVIGLIMIYTKQLRMLGLVLIVATVLQFCTVTALKLIVERPRPFEEYAVHALKTSFSSYSFPSSHTASLFCAATVVTAFRRNLAIPMFALACLVGLTRMYMYAHYPTDVLAGAVVGILCALFVIFTLLRMDPRTVYVEKSGPTEEFRN